MVAKLECHLINTFRPPNRGALILDRMNWAEHFEWRGALLSGRTGIGRATVKLLAINHPDYVLLRESLIDEGTFPPDRVP